MLPVYFPDLQHPERTVDMDRYVDMLLECSFNTNPAFANNRGSDEDSETPCRSLCAHLTRPQVYAVVEIVKNWALRTIARADEQHHDPIRTLHNATRELMLPSGVSQAVRQMRLEAVRRRQGNTWIAVFSCRRGGESIRRSRLSSGSGGARSGSSEPGARFQSPSQSS